MHLEARPERKTFPLNVILDGRRVLVVGGGQVGRRKIGLLLESGASVELVAPDAVAELAALAKDGKIVWTRREFRSGDAAGHLFAFACTDSKSVNRAVLDEARLVHVPCCCADGNWADGDFTTPAVARVGDVVLAVSTSGKSCRESRAVRDELARSLAESRDLSLIVLGTSDVCLPSRRRAPFHLPPDERAALGALVARVRGVREFMILNTCSRVELVAVASPDPAVVAVLRRLAGFDRLEPKEYYVLRGYEAFRHLTLVSSGIESSLLGEFHIVSQMKDAFDAAAAAGWSGAALRFTADEVMRVSKIVRHEVEGLLHVAEIDQIAVRYLTVHGGLDASTRVVVVGTGVVGTGVVRSLLPTGVKISWAYHVHAPVEPPPGVEVVPMTDLPTVLETADIVVSAVDSSKPVVAFADAAAVADRNVLMVDLGVPRNIDPAFDDFGHGVTVADLDDLKLWHRVNTGVLTEVRSRADAAIRREYREML